MLAIYAEGMLLGYIGIMTSHQNEKDRWSRHYSYSQNFTSITLFGKKNMLTSRLMSDLFWKLNLGNSYELIVTDATNQFLYSYLQGFHFFRQVDYRVCNPAVFPVWSTQWKMMEWAAPVITGKPSWGAYRFFDCKVFDPMRKKKGTKGIVTWSATWV